MSWWQKLKDIPAVMIDGALYVGIAFTGAVTAAFGTDEAAKFVAPAALFWVRAACAPLAASLLALKMFRSTGYAQHQHDKHPESKSP